MLVASGLEILANGRDALDQDGLRIDERGGGDIMGRVRDSQFIGNGADGIEFDEAGAGRVRATVSSTAIIDNGDFDVAADPDDGFDIDEADAGAVRLRLVDVVASSNVDEGVKVTEQGAGDLLARVLAETSRTPRTPPACCWRSSTPGSCAARSAP